MHDPGDLPVGQPGKELQADQVLRAAVEFLQSILKRVQGFFLDGVFFGRRFVVWLLVERFPLQPGEALALVVVVDHITRDGKQPRLKGAFLG